jgi:hypothetical protein
MNERPPAAEGLIERLGASAIQIRNAKMLAALVDLTVSALLAGAEMTALAYQWAKRKLFELTPGSLRT